LQEDALDDSSKSINLLIDATFFGRECGFLVFHDCQKLIYFKEIKTESVKDFREGINTLKASNYLICSITIEAEEATLKTSENCWERFLFKCSHNLFYFNCVSCKLPASLRHLCLFHQKAIIRRYIADRPRSQCGKDLKELMHHLCKPESHQEFIDQFYRLKDQYHYFLNQRNELGHYKHSALRSAFRSIDSNMLYLFTYSDFKGLNIPPTNNHLEGMFGHIKERVKIHRGLTKNRKKKAVRFLLKNWGRER
jgi:hypothetical protein